MKIEIYYFKGMPFRSAIDNNSKLWFCASDVCKALSYKNTSKAISDNCQSKGITTSYTLTDGGSQELTYIDEPNLYRLVMKSTKKEAIEFQDFVMEKVLPSIRKTGSFQIDKPLSQLDFLQIQLDMMKQQDQRILNVEEKIILLEAKTISSPNDYFAVAGYASLIKKNIDVKTAAELGRKASAMCKNLGFTTHSMPDLRFGSVKLYPVEILKSIFDEKNLK